jgi:predicted nucleotide-binding protein (sugar kinase/HSP70/actin superfamily)
LHSPAVIGLPRALLYYKFVSMWTSFFQLLGCEVVISPDTNRQILEWGIQHSIDENCLGKPLSRKSGQREKEIGEL